MKKYMNLKKLIVLAILGFSVSFSYAQEGKIRNVIFMIGDGMGLAHMQVAMMKSETPLSIERAQYVGLHKTYSANNRVTDSAAAGTAMATGNKTNNATLGVDKDGKPVKNLVEEAIEQGKKTGIVVTKTITDATPAAFMIHTDSRKNNEEIASLISEAKVDVLIGGGKADFESRSDGVNLLDKMAKAGYQVARTQAEMKAAKDGRLIALLAKKHMKPVVEGRKDILSESTTKALNLLQNDDKGFFLMVESSLIDKMGHGNNAEGVIAEVTDFDKTVGLVFDFADKNPGTLVIVTADHETGGLTIPSGNEDFTLSDQGVNLKFSTGGHTASMVPIYSYGAGAEKFTAIMENTDIAKKLFEILKSN